MNWHNGTQSLPGSPQQTHLKPQNPLGNRVKYTAAKLKKPLPETMTPLECYRADLQNGKIIEDPAQRLVIERLQVLYNELLYHVLTPQSWLKKLSSRIPGFAPRTVLGIYLWGGVGLGKTYLMDRFYDCLPTERKQRMHFHRFMQWIHNQLKNARNESHPLKIVAQRLAEKTSLLCLDEFYVSDIADAMILARLLQAMSEQGISLVITSNLPPEDLYKDGLQRELFLPAIKLLRRYTNVVKLDGKMDYRLRYLEKAELYHTPLDELSNEIMLGNFLHIVCDGGSESEPLEIEGRPIPTVRLGDGVVWFDFNAICNGPRSQIDYIEIARCFNTVFISDIPVLGKDNDIARRFINLVDVFYDRNVKLVMSAAALPDKLYQGKKLVFEFQRTTSRLIEMQSHDYLARPHLG